MCQGAPVRRPQVNEPIKMHGKGGCEPHQDQG